MLQTITGQEVHTGDRLREVAPIGLLPLTADLIVTDVDVAHNRVFLSRVLGGPPLTCVDEKTPRAFDPRKFVKVA